MVQRRKFYPSIANELVKPFNIHEVYVAIKALGTNVSLGIDSFPPEFFLCYWDQIGISVLEALQDDMLIWFHRSKSASSWTVKYLFYS